MRESLSLTHLEIVGASHCPSELVCTPIDTFSPHVPTLSTTYPGRRAQCWGICFSGATWSHPKIRPPNVVYVKDPSFDGNKASGSLARISSCRGVNNHYGTVFTLTVRHSHKFGSCSPGLRVLEPLSSFFSCREAEHCGNLMITTPYTKEQGTQLAGPNRSFEVLRFSIARLALDNRNYPPRLRRIRLVAMMGRQGY